MNKKTLVGMIVVAIIAIGGYFSGGDTIVKEVENNTGATASPEHFDRQYFTGGLTDGSSCYSVSATETVSVGDLEANNCLYIAPTGAGQGVLSLTLPPATTTEATLLPKVGACADWWVDASDVAAATTTTFVAGASMDLVGLDATGAGTGADVIDGAEFGKLTLCRQSDNGVTVFIQEWIHAD